LLQQEEDKLDTEPSKLDQRRAWAAELAGIPARRKKELPALAAAAEQARRAGLEAWDAATRARKASQDAMLASMMAQSALDGREEQLSLWLQGYEHPIVPDQPWDKNMPSVLVHLHNADNQVALMLEVSRHACRPVYERTERDSWGRERLINIYNHDEISKARQQLEAIRNALRQELLRADLDPPAQRAGGHAVAQGQADRNSAISRQSGGRHLSSRT